MDWGASVEASAGDGVPESDAAVPEWSRHLPNPEPGAVVLASINPTAV